MLSNDYKEWLRQADYDLKTAEYMFKGRRYFYAVFMVHLAVEKALKGIYQKVHKQIPPKTHNLLFLSEKSSAKLSEHLVKFLVKLNQASIVTRYPEDLKNLTKQYTAPVTREILRQSKEVLSCLKKM